MGGSADPNDPSQQQKGFVAAANQPAGKVAEICETCPDNWVETGAIDETSGKPIPGIGYRIYDVPTGDLVASGTLDEQGKSPRHYIPLPKTQLYVIFGTEAAMDEAAGKIKEWQRQEALKANAVKDWRGIPAGLNREEFDKQLTDKAARGEDIFADRGFLGQGGRGHQGMRRMPIALAKALFQGKDEAIDWFKEPYFDEAFDQYQLATGARAAGADESLGAGAAQGATFGFDEEISARLNSLLSDRSYDEIVGAQRQILQQNQISNPGYYAAGEIAGAVPTIFVPVGGAAANAARAGRGVTGAMRSGAAASAGAGAVSGAGHDEGGIIDRLDGAAFGAATGGIAGALLGGAGVLVARGVSRTRIWGRAKPETGGAVRRTQFGQGWPKGNLDESVIKFAGNNPLVSVTDKGKRIYENPSTGVQIVEDINGRYYRIFDPSLPGKRRYLDLDGLIPNNKIVDGRQIGRTQAEYNQATHFRIDD